jgi:two-component system sensor histidine kinase QseC
MSAQPPATEGAARDRFASLRFRLTASMALVLVLALAASALLDSLGRAVHVAAPGLAALLDVEPYQDGLVLGSFGLCVGVLIWLVSIWSLRPLSRASEEAALAGPEHPGVRISAHRLPTEIRPLVAAVNGALDRLEAAFEAERRFTANAAHELRTPLSILSLRLQQARREGAPDWDAVERDVGQMTRLVAQLLDLARKEQVAHRPDDAEFQPVNLSRIAREAAATILPLAEAAGRPLRVDLPQALPVRGRPDDLRDMIVNLLENAIIHGAGGITLTGGLAGGAPAQALLEVADEGQGVPDALREMLFERFRKAVPGSSGTGLGLAIVREVARAHGGHAAFQPGPTTRVRITLPGAA